MRRSKKLILAGLLATVVLAGSIGGVALASEGDDDCSPAARFGNLIDRVCNIYDDNPETTGDINREALKSAFADARSEICAEGMPNSGEVDPEAIQNHLQTLYDEGKITEEQYLRMQERLESMPDNMPGFGFHGHGGFRNFGGPCAPVE